MNKVVKRDGTLEDFEVSKIKKAINNAARKVGDINNKETSRIAELVKEDLKTMDNSIITVDNIHDSVIKILTENKHIRTVTEYIEARGYKKKIKDNALKIMNEINEITFVDADDLDEKRENANIDTDTSMGTMLKYGTTVSKENALEYSISGKISKAHRKGDMHIHDLDFYNLTTTCTQIDLEKLFKGGFSTGHGHLREPSNIKSYSALACIAIQSNQNDQHGGQSVPCFDYYMAEGVKKSFIRNIAQIYEIIEDDVDIIDIKHRLIEYTEDMDTVMSKESIEKIKEFMQTELGIDDKLVNKLIKKSILTTDRDTYQAMESFVHNLNSMHSRAGSQVPFSSINFGTDTSVEGRMVTRNLLLSIKAGLGNGETAIFPVSIFKVKEGVNYNEGDPNYDLFKLSMEVSAIRMFPNYAFLDAPFNLRYYKKGNKDTEIAYMGCRTRVIGNVYDPKREIVTGRGNLSFTSINLPRIAINSKGDMEKFYGDLDDILEIVCTQLLDRLKIQSEKKVLNFPFLMGQNIWLDSDRLGKNDTLDEVLKHGTLSVGFIGLAETLVQLTGKHHGESEESQKLGRAIIGYMREFLDKKALDTGLNFTLLATPAEGLSGRFVKLDRERYGVIKGVTDREYYTNSFHIPVYFPISAIKKIELEAPYHALTNAGHITYIEMDGDVSKNIEAFESIVRCMKENGIGYGAINHPIDRDPVCGYTGIINDVCPRCGRHEGEAISKEKLTELQRQYTNVPLEVYRR